MRRSHVLKDNKGNEKPQLIVYIDSESRVIDNLHHPYLVIACFKDVKKKKERWKEYFDSEVYKVWDDIAKFNRKKTKVYVYAHNMGYDLIATSGITKLVENGYIVSNYFEKGNVFIMNFHKMENDGNVDRSIVLLSSTNYFAESLASLGKTFGLEKLDFDYENGTIEEAVIYCKRDVEILKRAVEEFLNFVEEENLGCTAKTLAGQAFNAFRHRFMKHEIIIHDNEVILELEREAYCGGRVECRRIGKFTGKFYYYDVNSMYPYVMRDYKYPTKLRTVQLNCTLNRLTKFIDQGKCLIAKCIVETEEPVFPVKINNNLIFPVGKFYTTISTPEIIYGLEKGYIKGVKIVAVYDAEEIFKDYVNYFYTMRQKSKLEGDKVRDKMYKLLLNSLYGKFGQKGEQWERIGSAPIDKVGVFEIYNETTGEHETVKIFGGSMFKKVNETESYNSFPAIAAHVTAYARMTLYNYMQIAGFRNVYYVDTDSLFVNATGHENLEPYHNELELGKIKLETEAEELSIYAPKDYEFGKIVKRKGIKKGSEKIDDTTYKTTVWPKLNGVIRDGNISQYKNIERIKVLKRQYTKGWVSKTGNVEPFELNIDTNGKNIILPPKIELLTEEQLNWVSKKFKKENVGW